MAIHIRVPCVDIEYSHNNQQIILSNLLVCYDKVGNFLSFNERKIYNLTIDFLNDYLIQRITTYICE